MEKKKQLINAFIAFKIAAINLSYQWEEYDQEGDDFTEAYPFDQSFDELTARISDWADKSISSINS